MTDHTTHDSPLGLWQSFERASRVAWTMQRINTLATLATQLEPNDRVDAARGIWLEYVDGHGTTDLDRVGEAHILAAIYQWLPQSDVVKFARNAWGDRMLDAHARDDLHITWWPDDSSVIIQHTTRIGTVATLVLTETSATGRLR